MKHKNVVKADEWPRVESEGHASVKIYKNQIEKPQPDGLIKTEDIFRLAWYDNAGKRLFKQFTEFEAARTYAREILSLLSTGRAAFVMTPGEKEIFQRANAVALQLGVTLEEGMNQLAAAKAKLGPVALTVAIDAYLKTNRGLTDKTVKEVVDEMIHEKLFPAKNRKTISDAYHADLKSRLGRFAKAFADVPITSMTCEQIKSFFDNLGGGGYNLFGFGRLVRGLFFYAKAKRYFPKDVDPFECLDTSYSHETAPEIYTPKETAAMLEHCTPRFIPFLAISLFAGIRSAELMRLDWSNVRENFIEIPASIAKLRSRRLVPIQPNLQAWLAPHRKADGAIWPFLTIQVEKKRIAQLSGVEPKRNAARHSFISYRVVIEPDVNKVSMEAGNSPVMIFRHYRELATPEDAKAYFSIMPTASANVLPANFAAA